VAFQDVTATFTGAEAYVDVIWPTAYATFEFTQGIFATDGYGDIEVNVIPCPGFAMNQRLRVVPSAPFVGTVTLLAFQT